MFGAIQIMLQAKPAKRALKTKLKSLLESA